MSILPSNVFFYSTSDGHVTRLHPVLAHFLYGHKSICYFGDPKVFCVDHGAYSYSSRELDDLFDLIGCSDGKKISFADFAHRCHDHNIKVHFIKDNNLLRILSNTEKWFKKDISWYQSVLQKVGVLI